MKMIFRLRGIAKEIGLSPTIIHKIRTGKQEDLKD